MRGRPLATALLALALLPAGSISTMAADEPAAPSTLRQKATAALADVAAEARARIAVAEADARGSIDDAGDDARAAIDAIGASVDGLATSTGAAIDARVGDAVATIGRFDAADAATDLLTTLEAMDTVIAIAERAATARAAVATARLWVEANPEETCDASAFLVGAGAAALVGLLSESPGAALAAYGQSRDFARDVCATFAR